MKQDGQLYTPVAASMPHALQMSFAALEGFPASESQSETPYSPCDNMCTLQTQQGKRARLATPCREHQRLWRTYQNLIFAAD